MPKIQLYKCIS